MTQTQDALAAKSRAADSEPELEIGLIYTYEDHWMEPLLKTLAASAPGLRTKLLLVDNDSQRNADRWTAQFPQTRVIRNERRYGYAENLNRILRVSRAPYVLLLNTDMVFDPAEQALTKLVDFMDRNPQCGLCSPRIYRYDGSYCFPARRFPTWQTAVGRRLGESRYFRPHVASYFYADRDPYATMPCDWVTGCFMLVRREALEAVGQLDVGFTKYFEDVDWCARMTAAGYQVMLCGETHCFHAEQRASKRVFSVDGRKHLQSYARWLWKYRRGAPASSPVSPPSSRSEAVLPPRLPLNGDFERPSNEPAVVPERRAA